MGGCVEGFIGLGSTVKAAPSHSCAVHPDSWANFIIQGGTAAMAFAWSAGPPTTRPHRSICRCAKLLDHKLGVSARSLPTRSDCRSRCPDMLKVLRSSVEEQFSAASNRGRRGIWMRTLSQAAVLSAVLAMAFWPKDLPHEKTLQRNQHQFSAAPPPLALAGSRAHQVDSTLKRDW